MPARRRVRLDAAYPLGTQPGEASVQDRYEGPKQPYLALYRMNTGHWRSERHFTAVSDAEALAEANRMISNKKPRDLTYMVLHALYALETEETPGDQP